MGWNPFSSASATRGDEIRSGAAIPTRSERAACWAARDAYFTCLEAHQIVDVTKADGPGAEAARRHCAEAEAGFARDCSAAWVRYFKQWRVADFQKRRRLEQLDREGAVEVGVESSFVGGGNIASRKGPLPKSQVSKTELQDMMAKTKVEAEAEAAGRK